MNRFANCIFTLVLIGLLIATWGCSKSQPEAPATSATAEKGATQQAAPAQPAPTPPQVVGGGPYSPNVGHTYPNRVLWGLTHIHTDLSADSGLMGITLGPDQLFESAMGHEVMTTTGLKFKLERPLDWLAITDHAEFLGLSGQLASGNPELLANPTGKKWYDLSRGTPQQKFEGAWDVFQTIASAKDPINNPKLQVSAWMEAYEAAEKYNQPGVFTTLHGFEWTSVPGGNNLHRTVIFRDNVDRVKQTIPYSAFDSQNPADLWKYMDEYVQKTGGQVLAIPHNGNLSNGLMYTAETYDSKPMDRAYAESRIGHEPLMEVTQIKGDGEAHPYLSPNDEFANFELWDFGNLADHPVPKKKDMLQYEYARAALKTGLEQEVKLGANPYQFGMVGASDAHIGVVDSRQDNFFGQFIWDAPSPTRWQLPMLKYADGKVASYYWQDIPAGLGGVWSRENTREAIWDALKRKEVYATTGERPIVRVFGGWDFVPADKDSPNFAEQGYARGVPMGGNLTNAPAGKSPAFVVFAQRDPYGSNLDRIQIIKGWVGKDGKAQERIFDVAVSGGRKIGPDGRCKTSVGNTVDVANATYSNSIGAAYLSAYWKDPAFDPQEHAFYYVRVIQIPSPRWTAYDQKRFGIKMAANVPMTTTGRAYTSPIWYKP